MRCVGGARGQDENLRIAKATGEARLCERARKPNRSWRDLLPPISLLVPALLAVVLPASADTASNQLDATSAQLAQQRAQFKEAMGHFQAGRFDRYRSLTDGLDEYILYPYLRYIDLERNFSRASADEILDFTNRFADSPLAARLKNQWLRQLMAERRYGEYLTHLSTEVDAPEFACWRLQALMETGKRSEALAAVPMLWAEPRSMPSGCDGAFDAWKKEKGVPNDLAWTRFRGAMLAGDIGLAQHVSQYLAGEHLEIGRRWLEVHANPARVAKIRFGEHADWQYVMHHGLQRWARSDVAKAYSLWQSWQEKFSFEINASNATNAVLLRYLADQDRLASVPKVLPTEDDKYDLALEALLRYSLRHRRWHELVTAISALPDTMQTEPRWRYWLARAMELSGSAGDRQDGYLGLYRVLATDRSFYGFFAADRLGLEPALAEQPAPSDPAQLSAMRDRPAVRRVFELIAVDRLSDARAEWKFLLDGLSNHDKLVAGAVASERGMHRMAIQTVIDSKAWDVLQLRFPTAYQELMVPAATAQGIESSWVYAITRQESAFMEDARSPVGALGLMQLMPATGKSTANRLGLAVRNNYDILIPSNNVKLGSYYLAEQYKSFGFHRALASAAYNAGPGRVRQWSKAVPISPVDIWIESIPFKETRNYVQNVLFYSHIYSRLLGDAKPFLFDHER